MRIPRQNPPSEAAAPPLTSGESAPPDASGGGSSPIPMNPILKNLARGALLLVSAVALQAASPWSVRLRATYLETVDKSDAFTALGIKFADNAISVSDKFIPEIDVAYAFNDTISAELVLTVPQKHDVTLAGVGKLGSFRHLPPTLLFQYRANPGGSIRPYFAAGLNFTLIWDDNLVVAGVPLGLESNSLGVAAQAGIDWKIDDRWSFNLDIKRAAIRTDVNAGPARLTEARLDPLLYAIGLRYAF